MWERRDKISVTHSITTVVAQRESKSNPSMIHNNGEEQKASEIDVDTKMEEIIEEIEEGMENAKRANQNYLVRKGDVLPLLAPGSDGHNFWLFLCDSKCKRDKSINGKWFLQSRRWFEYVRIPLERIVFSGIPRRIGEKFYLVIVLTWKMLIKESSSCLLQLTTTCMILQRFRCNLLHQIGISRYAPVMGYSERVALFQTIIQ